MPYNYGNYNGSNYNNWYQYPISQTASPNNFNQQQYPQTAVPMSQLPQNIQSPSANQGFVWVQGEAGAKAYPVAAGNSVLLMDSEAPVLYMKSTDSSGRPLPIETYDLVKRASAPVQAPSIPKAPEIDLSEYVKSSELETKVTELIEKALGK